VVVVVVVVGFEFPQVVSEGRIEERTLAQTESAELLLLACCMTQTGTDQIGSDSVWCLLRYGATDHRANTKTCPRLSCDL
jgi:hypothetical protein